MDFVPPERRPNVVYLDEEEVNSDLIYDRQGQMKEVIERESQEEQVSTEAEAGGTIPGLSTLRAAIAAHWKQGEEMEFVRDLDHPDAKLALFLESVAEDDAITVISERFDESDRADLNQADLILIVGGLRRTPFSEIKDQFDMGDMLDDMKEGLRGYKKMAERMNMDTDRIEETEEQIEAMEAGAKGLRLMTGAISADEDIYRARAPESDIDFVMRLEAENFERRSFGFPDPSGEYYIIGKVWEKFGQDQNVPLIRFSEMVVTENPRKQKTKERQKRVEIKDLAKEFVNNREIENSKFDISYPDIQIQPLMIYRKFVIVLFPEF